MSEKIIRIEQESFKLESEIWDQWHDGYTIITDQQTIKLGISNDQQCCENWGYLMSEDNFDDFIGASLLNIQVVDQKLEKVELPDIYGGDAMFVNIETSAGLLQFVAYNEHNGYYGHDAVCVSKQLNHSERL